MTAADLFESVRSGVFQVEHLIEGSVVASGTGFLAHGYFLTNNHVFAGPAKATVRLSTQPTSEVSSRQSVDIPSERWVECLKSGSPEGNHDFAVLELPMLNTPSAYQFELKSPGRTRVGDSIAVLGFPFGCANLVCHLGSVSSLYQRNETSVIQLDASINVSNSGGPLIELSTGSVIGIVTRKAHGFTREIEQLKKLAKMNKDVADKLGLGPKPAIGISTGHLAQESFDAQVKLINELERSANVGIGYAFSIEHVLCDNVFGSR